MPVLGVIPARLGSTRLPRKPLQPLGGVPLVVRVAQQIQSLEITDRLVVATDSTEIEAAVLEAGFEAILTSPHHPSGTDRVYEIVTRREFAGFDEILNAQGDAPFLALAAAAGALRQLRQDRDVGTAAERLDPADQLDRSRVKVVINPSGLAVTFSRSGIPGQSNWRHVGVYAYRRPALERLARAAPTAQELAHGLEQLRALELGLSIGVARLDESAGPAIDTLADLELAQAHWNLLHEVLQ